jgi:hypothetical protein
VVAELDFRLEPSPLEAVSGMQEGETRAGDDDHDAFEDHEYGFVADE